MSGRYYKGRKKKKCPKRHVIFVSTRSPPNGKRHNPRPPARQPIGPTTLRRRRIGSVPHAHAHGQDRRTRTRGNNTYNTIFPSFARYFHHLSFTRFRRVLSRLPRVSWFVFVFIRIPGLPFCLFPTTPRPPPPTILLLLFAHARSCTVYLHCFVLLWSALVHFNNTLTCLRSTFVHCATVTTASSHRRLLKFISITPDHQGIPVTFSDTRSRTVLR